MTARDVLAAYYTDDRTRGMSPLEILALAVKDANRRAASAELSNRELRDELNSMTRSYARVTVEAFEPQLSPSDLGYVAVVMKPMRYETRLPTSNPASWGAQAKSAFVEHASELFANLLAEQIFKKSN